MDLPPFARRGASGLYKLTTGQYFSRRSGKLARYSVEAPRFLDRYAHRVEVRGWIAPRTDEPVYVRARLDDDVLGEARADEPRPDVAAALGITSGPAPRGFRFIAQGPSLSSRRMATLRLEAVMPGPIVDPLWRVPVVRVTAGGSLMPRFAYREVWDRSASSLADARVAVAGYVDEDEWNRSGESTAERIASCTRITTDDVVLEIGCGAGRVGAKLAPRCRTWIGADVSPNMLAFARAALQQAGHRNAQFVPLNGFDLAAIPDSSVDVVYCTAVFMHLDEWERYGYIVEARRVLRPGGRLYVDNFDLGSEMGWELFQGMARLDPARRPPNVSKSSTGEELRIYAERAAFTNITIDHGRLFVSLAEKPAG